MLIISSVMFDKLEKEKKPVGDQGIERLDSMERYCGLEGLVPFGFVLLLGIASIIVPSAQGWSKEGHIMTCRIAQVNLLPFLLRGG